MTRTRGTKHRARRTAAQWQELVERFERTGQTRGRFCAAHGLTLSTFDLWRRKLRATPAAVNEEQPEALFVELTNPTQTQLNRTALLALIEGVDIKIVRQRKRYRKAAASAVPKMRVNGRSEDVIFFDGVFFKPLLKSIFFVS